MVPSEVVRYQTGTGSASTVFTQLHGYSLKETATIPNDADVTLRDGATDVIHIRLDPRGSETTILPAAIGAGVWSVVVNSGTVAWTVIGR